MTGSMLSALLGGDPEACIPFCFVSRSVCADYTHMYIMLKRYSSDLSENRLLNTQAVLSLHHTIQLFMNLNKKVTLLL